MAEGAPQTQVSFEHASAVGSEAVSHLYGFSGEPSDVRTSFALTGNAAVDVFVLQDSGAAEDAASHASTAGAGAPRLKFAERYVADPWVRGV